jgi:hypothetical protein
MQLDIRSLRHCIRALLRSPDAIAIACARWWPPCPAPDARSSRGRRSPSCAVRRRSATGIATRVPCRCSALALPLSECIGLHTSRRYALRPPHGSVRRTRTRSPAEGGVASASSRQGARRDTSDREQTPSKALRQQIRRFLGALRPDIDRVRLPATEIGEDMPETLDDIRVCRRLRVTAMCSGNAGVMQRRQKPSRG